MVVQYPPCTPSPSCVDPLRCHPSLPPCATPEKCLQTSKSKGRKPCESAVAILKDRAPACCCKPNRCRKMFGRTFRNTDHQFRRNETRKQRYIREYFRKKDAQARREARGKPGTHNTPNTKRCDNRCKPPRMKTRPQEKKGCTIL